MNSNIDVLIGQDRDFIAAVVRSENLFGQHYDIIKETNYDLKFIKEPLALWSTTLGKRYVRITQDYFKWNQIDRSAHLIHEATHSMQYDRIGGNLKFWYAYLFKNKKNEFEAEAAFQETMFKIHALCFVRRSGL